MQTMQTIIITLTTIPLHNEPLQHVNFKTKINADWFYYNYIMPKKCNVPAFWQLLIMLRDFSYHAIHHRDLFRHNAPIVHAQTYSLENMFKPKASTQ